MTIVRPLRQKAPRPAAQEHRGHTPRVANGALIGTGTARGALLADTMGLGKTATAVVAAYRARMHRVLVVCPKSAIPDWRRELDDWNSRPGVVRVLPRQPFFDFGVGWTIMNYEMLERFADDLRRRQWDLIVLDEGHATKEPSRRRTILIHGGGDWKDKPYRPIPARKALVISGTPLKNRVEEISPRSTSSTPTTGPTATRSSTRTTRGKRATATRASSPPRAAWCRTSRRGTSTPCTVG